MKTATLRSPLIAAAFAAVALLASSAAQAEHRWGGGSRWHGYVEGPHYGGPRQFGNPYHFGGTPWWARRGFRSEHAARHHFRKMREFEARGIIGPRGGYYGGF